MTAASERPMQDAPSRRPVQPALVVLIDDNEAHQILARTLLERRGWVVRCFEDVPAALEFLAHTLPSALLVDLHMPGASAMDFVPRIQQCCAGADLKLIAHTAQAPQEGLEHLIQMGFDDVLIKPATDKDLRRILGQP